MQKSVFYQRSFRTYLIPILLLVFSFVMYSYNLGEQPSYGDELLHFGWGGVYFELIKEGDFDNPCLKGLAGCELLYDPQLEFPGFKGHNVNYSPLRNFFVGLGYFLSNDEKENFYEWSCAWLSCWDLGREPTSEEFSAGRFFSPIFGSLTIVLAFFIGKILFNRTTGLFFSLILLFYSLWMVNSRLIMSEVYLYFFIFLSVLFLLKSFKKENNHRIAYFIFGSISFGLALNIKLVAIEFTIPILVMILFYESFNEKLNFRFFKKKKNVFKVISVVLVFFLVSSISYISTVPIYYDDTLNQILNTSDSSDIGYASLPTPEKNYLFNTLVTLQITLFPYLMDSYIHDVFPDEAHKSRLTSEYRSNSSDITPSNYSTIPLSLFFLIGLIYLIKKIKTRNLKFSEFTLLVFFTSLFIWTVLTVNAATIERYYLPLMFSIILVASYGLGRFIQQIHSQKEKILFFVSFIIAHSLYIIPFVGEMYLSDEVHSLAFRFWIPERSWLSPLPVSSQLSLNDPLVYVSTITFLMIFGLIYLRIKIRTPVETKQDML